MYQQRDQPETTGLVGLWGPSIVTVDGVAIEFVPKRDDAYVVLDEMISDQVRLAVAAWPNVDEGGRLRFSGSGSASLAVGHQRLQEEVDRLRESEGQLVRPVRIGDVFLVRGLGGESDDWERLLDVTGAARRAANRAGVRAVAQSTEEVSQTGGVEPVEAASEPSWRRPPEQLPAAPPVRPPAEPTPGSISNAAV